MIHSPWCVVVLGNSSDGMDHSLVMCCCCVECLSPLTACGRHLAVDFPAEIGAGQRFITALLH